MNADLIICINESTTCLPFKSGSPSRRKTWRRTRTDSVENQLPFFTAQQREIHHDLPSLCCWLRLTLMYRISESRWVVGSQSLDRNKRGIHVVVRAQFFYLNKTFSCSELSWCEVELETILYNIEQKQFFFHNRLLSTYKYCVYVFLPSEKSKTSLQKSTG